MLPVSPASRRKRRRETCWSAARRRARHARQRARRRRSGGVVGTILFAYMSALIAELAAGLLRSSASVPRPRPARTSGVCVQPSGRLAASAVPWRPLVEHRPRYGRRADDGDMTLQSAVLAVEASSRGRKPLCGAPSVDDAWAYIDSLGSDAALYLRSVEAEGGGAWTPVRYDLVKRPSEAVAIWSERGRALREESEQAPAPELAPETESGPELGG